ncbi:MAG: CotH kinase family protein [Cryomorphaceae bacterium]
MPLRFLIFLSTLIATPLWSQTLVINEIVASNSNGIEDEDGDREDWIELYNFGSDTVNPGGLYLSDDYSETLMWEIPDTPLAPGQFMLIFASGKDRISAPNLHTNFKISKNGEPILLSAADGTVIDVYHPVVLLTDQGYGRLTDGGEALVYFSTPTPGSTNQGATLAGPPNEFVGYSHATGFYADTVMLELIATSPESQIYYTLDGTLPTDTAMLYEGPFPIYDRTDEDNGIAMIPTNPTNAPTEYRWKAPDGQVFKGTVVRAAAYSNGIPQTAVTTKTYFIDPVGRKRFTLPVIALNTAPDHLYDYETGIYVPGLFHDQHPTTWYWGSGNYHQRGRDWERPVHFALIDTFNVPHLEMDGGLRMHGGGSRALPQKTHRIYARSDYGKEALNYPFFRTMTDASFSRIILRNSGQDFNATMFKDALAVSLVSHLDLEIQHSEPAAVFVNGVYWGIQNIRERIDKHYIARRTGANPDNLDIMNLRSIVEVTEGSYDHFENFLSALETANMNSDAARALVEHTIVVENYFDHVISKVYFSAYDWPGNNVRFWREREPGSKYRYVLFDNDDAFRDVNHNTLEHGTATDGDHWPNPPWSTFLLRKVLENDSLRSRFIHRAHYHLSETFAPERVIAAVDSFEVLYDPHIEEHIKRWGYPESKNVWSGKIEEFRQFAQYRPCMVSVHFTEKFGPAESIIFNDLCGTVTTTDPVSDLEITGLYPNPNKGSFRVEFFTKINSVQPVTISITDLTGKSVFSERFNARPKNNNRDISTNLRPGFYLIHLKGREGQTARKFAVY